MRFGPIAPSPYLAVTYQGTVRDRDGRNALYLECTSTGRSRPVASGGSHSAILEVIVPTPADWCPKGDVYLHMRANSTTANLGVAVPYQSSAIALLKRSFVGKAVYFLLAFATAASIFFLGGTAARRFGRGLDPVLGGLLAIGAASLGMFYLHAWTPLPSPWGAAFMLVAFLTTFAIPWRAPALARSVWRVQKMPMSIWFIVAFVAFTLLLLGSTGSGGWEPNYRYAPATWSSDHTLPMSFAEAARVGSVPVEGQLGSWSLSDRSPLLAGSYLLLSDMYALLQTNNQGLHLQPVVLGLGGIVFCAMWSAAFYWAARRIGRQSVLIAALGTFLVAATPFALFNTGYTFSKLFAAAFSLTAAAYVFRPRAGSVRPGEAAVFGALSGFALMSHATSAFFLAPVAFFYLTGRLWRAPKALIIGAAIGLGILAGWSAFKVAVLPGAEPLLKFALTGDFAVYRPAPSPDALSDKVGFLRNWDFYSLGIGNGAILLLAAGGGFLTAKRASDRDAWRPSGLLLAVSLLCLVLSLMATVLPLVAHQFSYDAILAAALGGVVALARARWGPLSLAILFVATLLYTLFVWVAAPLRQLVTLDLVSVATLSIFLFLLVYRNRLAPPPENTPGPLATPVALMAVVLAAALVVGGLLIAPGVVARPASATISTIGTAAPPLADLKPSSCLGSFDGAAPREVGGWRLYG